MNLIPTYELFNGRPSSKLLAVEISTRQFHGLVIKDGIIQIDTINPISFAEWQTETYLKLLRKKQTDTYLELSKKRLR